uniref:Uncharacterized protein n=1 Tax=Grammatophora oceanica TaxID=210454 RepID=A0A7S1Y569_9STRA|mmetsp:Transcript_21045/g.31218  ORF Transcript_21045/g.31218 Transcript_21045/m.31218 type:complete len:134 (+) Transcript_21045:208-609(+)
MVCGSRIRLIFVIAQSPAECSPSSDRLQQQSRRSGFYNTLVLKHLPDLVRRIAEDDVSPRELRRELNKFHPKVDLESFVYARLAEDFQLAAKEIRRKLRIRKRPDKFTYMENYLQQPQRFASCAIDSVDGNRG